jgi:hypothetical protein
MGVKWLHYVHPEIFSHFQILFFPFVISMHWLLLVVFIDTQGIEIHVYDSAGMWLLSILASMSDRIFFCNSNNTDK